MTKIIDADSHILEPPNMWQEYIEPKFRDRAPYVLLREEGADTFVLEKSTALLGDDKGDSIFEQGIGHFGSFGSAWGKGDIEGNYLDCIEGYDPHMRVKHMDNERIDATLLFPGLGLLMGGISDPFFAEACYSAYNKWLADFCSPYKDRLIGAAMIPLQDVGCAIKELKYVRNNLGYKVIFIRPNQCLGRHLHSSYYDPFWKEVEELDVSVAIHTGSAIDMPSVGSFAFSESFMTRHIVAHTMDVMLGMLSIIFCGICERFPNIRFAFFESGGGWVPGWLERMDRHFKKKFYDGELKLPPSEYFSRQCWIGFDPDEASMSVIGKYLGIDKVLWSTDFPHPDGMPDAVKLIEGLSDLTSIEKMKILGMNAKTFINLS